MHTHLCTNKHTYAHPPLCHACNTPTHKHTIHCSHRHVHTHLCLHTHLCTYTHPHTHSSRYTCTAPHLHSPPPTHKSISRHTRTHGHSPHLHTYKRPHTHTQATHMYTYFCTLPTHTPPYSPIPTHPPQCLACPLGSRAVADGRGQEGDALLPRAPLPPRDAPCSAERPLLPRTPVLPGRPHAPLLHPHLPSLQASGDLRAACSLRRWPCPRQVPRFHSPACGATRVTSFKQAWRGRCLASVHGHLCDT